MAKFTFAILLALPAFAQTAPRAVTTADYAHAEAFMGYRTTPLVYGAVARPSWIDGDRVWYRVSTAAGTDFVMVDAARGAKSPAFDQAKLAAALSTAAGTTYDAHHLPFTDFELAGDTISLNIGSKRWKCDLAGNQCAADAAGGGRRGRGGSNESISPDKKRAVFIRDNNLWSRDIESGKETQLTTDGAKDFAYATDNAGWASSDRPIVMWSPDSKKVATYQQDERGVGEMYLVNTTVGHPELKAWKYPLPGDAVITTIQRVVIDVADPHVVRLKMPADEHRSSLCDNIACRGGEWSDVQWNGDSSAVAFVSTSRDHKQEHLKIANASTGEIRDILDESVPTFYESGNGRVNWKYLPDSNELIWFSERDNWGQLYLYDAATGRLKNQITTGEGSVSQLLRVDEKNRVLYFLATGREPGRDPYFIHFYRVGFDGKEPCVAHT